MKNPEKTPAPAKGNTLRNNGPSTNIMLTADGMPPVIVPLFGRARGRIDEGPGGEDVTLSDDQLTAYASVMVGPPGKQISQLDYFCARGLELR